MGQKIRIIFGIIMSLLIVYLLSQPLWLKNIITELRPKKTIDTITINYDEVFDDGTVTEIELYPTVIVVTEIPISMTPIPTMTMIPSPTPTEIILIPTYYLPTKSPIEERPTTVPTKKPTPTKIIDPLLVKNPLSQPYYDPKRAYLCYNNDAFINEYANGASSTNCFSQVKANVEKNLTSVTLWGKSITVHKKAYPAFLAVSKAIDNSSVAKKYKIRNIGAYIFRCNVNASTSGKFDTCDPGCVLSAHSFGIAVDINYDTNCNGCSDYDMPKEVVKIFEDYGFRWGGRYKQIFGANIDAMHFEYMYGVCKP